MRILILKTKVIWNPLIKTWCGKPYLKHPKGCPNFNIKKGCPMNNKNIDEIFDISKPVFLVGIDFDLKQHRNLMKLRHPDWTFKQCNNVLYWQSKHKKQLRDVVKDFLKVYPNLVADYLPEGHGVNVSAMMRKVGKPLNWHYPLKKVWRIALIGQLK